MIQNPTPIVAQPFNGMWVTNLGIFFPTVEKPKGFIAGNLSPYDGSNLLATNTKRLFIGDLATKLTDDAQLTAILSGLKTEVKRQANKSVEPIYVTVAAPSPTLPVRAYVAFSDKTFFTIKDCYALCATDSTFAVTLVSVINEVARQAGLTNV